MNVCVYGCFQGLLRVYYMVKAIIIIYSLHVNEHQNDIPKIFVPYRSVPP